MNAGMTPFSRLLERIDATPFIDTHEHLLDESTRLAGEHHRLGCNDWSTLLGQYVCDDLVSSGLPNETMRRVLAEPMDPAAKFAIVAPAWEKMRHTGYGQALRRSISTLYGLSDLDARTAPQLAERHQDAQRAGRYDEILRDTCRILHCHVNSMEHPVFRVTEQPDLLGQDINITHLISPFGNSEITPFYGDRMQTLEDWLSCVTAIFDRFGPHAAGVKSISAYHRRLDFAPVDRRRAEAIFREAAPFQWAPPDDMKQLEDFLLRFCIDQAIRHRLPVKFHTGHHAGCGTMKMAQVAANAGDISMLVRDFPDANFVMFHIGYPYQNEMLSLAKHYPNVHIDMCWAWIIDPVASVQFLKQFLVTVPSGKVLTFGGDYLVPEPVVGHAQMARRGIALALSQLVAEGWLAEEEAPPLIEALMHGNAGALFGPPKPGLSMAELPSSNGK